MGTGIPLRNAQQASERSPHGTKVGSLSHTSHGWFRYCFSSLCRVLCTDRSLYLCAISLASILHLVRSTPRNSIFNPKKVYSLACWGHQAGQTTGQHQQGFNPHLHAIPGRLLSVATLTLPPASFSCRALTGSRHITQSLFSEPGAVSWYYFTRRYSGSPRWILFLGQLVCLSLAGRWANHQVR